MRDPVTEIARAFEADGLGLLNPAGYRRRASALDGNGSDHGVE
jgi:hypothetical protein